MTNTVKFLIGAGVTAVGIGMMVHYSKKVKERKYINTTPNTEENEQSPVERVKSLAMKKAVIFMSWALTHKKEIEGVTVMLSLGSAIFSLASSIRKYMDGKKLLFRLEVIETNLHNFIDAYNHNIKLDAQNLDILTANIEGIVNTALDNYQMYD